MLYEAHDWLIASRHVKYNQYFTKLLDPRTALSHRDSRDQTHLQTGRIKPGYRGHQTNLNLKPKPRPEEDLLIA